MSVILLVVRFRSAGAGHKWGVLLFKRLLRNVVSALTLHLRTRGLVLKVGFRMLLRPLGFGLQLGMFVETGWFVEVCLTSYSC